MGAQYPWHPSYRVDRYSCHPLKKQSPRHGGSSWSLFFFFTPCLGLCFFGGWQEYRSTLYVCLCPRDRVRNITKTKGIFFYKKCYSTSSRTFQITSESEDEQRPVLVSAHPPPKIIRASWASVIAHKHLLHLIIWM